MVFKRFQNRTLTGLSGFRVLNDSGISLVELVIALFCVSVALTASLVYFNNYQKGLLLEVSAKRIVESVALARAYALSERKQFFVVFEQDSVTILRSDGGLVGKSYRLPRRISVKEKSKGFDPVVLRPDGTSGTGGYLVLRDDGGGGEIRIVLHNITGRCFIER